MRIIAWLVPIPLIVVAWACGTDDSPSEDRDAATDASTPDATPRDGGGDAAQGQCSDYSRLKRPYFGDLHAHTAYSLDAFAYATRNTPFDAYAYARGKTLQIAGAAPDGGGPTTTIDRPLDFLAITDHSEFLATTYGCGIDPAGAPYDPQSPYVDSGTCAQVRAADPASAFNTFNNQVTIDDTLCDGGGCGPVLASAWLSIQQAAASANVPCSFTSFVGYEWTRSAGAAQLHKNVLFATDKVPSSPLDSRNYPFDVSLWQGLDKECLSAKGCEALTIPHNSNQSDGTAFIVPDGGESAMVKYQRLVEVIQHKGASECFFDGDGGDPDCNFEYLNNRANNPQSYVRTGLENGLSILRATQANPLEMGFVGGTDGHNGMPGNTREDGWSGHFGTMDDTPASRVAGPADGGIGNNVFRNPGGLTGVWAEENTRASIFAALRRRETFATSGTRILVRFYQTWDPADPCADASFPAKIVASGGVPMGSTFGAPPAGTGAGKPYFVAAAWKDTTDLARVDIIKAWVGANGQVNERVVRSPATSGAAACVFWHDTDFVPGPTFYYARILEKPTPRWSVFDCAKDPSANPQQCVDGGALQVQIQERAWTSPIWFRP